ncbi:unannotated protein [freshwater metagenome]|uniref:Unannotated protein n=1 Tax=freshwater metagenome TaxID=449393 RepID=A0A6J7KQ18_9ZZZZ
MDRAGFTEVLVTGMLMRWMSTSAKPMAMGAAAPTAFLAVVPRMTNRKPAVMTTSVMSAALIENPPGESLPYPLAANAPAWVLSIV